jgi:septum formation topological specificity factor MinE
MAELARAVEPFRFYTRLHLTELTGLRAAGLVELVRLLKSVPGGSIYYHTHRFLQQHQYLSPEPPNDFAYWVREILGEEELGERLASIDIIQYSTIRSLRESIVEVVEKYLQQRPEAKRRFAQEGEEFYFKKAVSFILPTDHVSYNLREFIDILKWITVDSLYFHIFEARLRLEKKTNDFSNWIENSIGNRDLALSIARLDPYVYTMEDLRRTIVDLIEKEIG